MTQRRICQRCGDAIVSNYFDALMAGIGKRGSTFSDVDAITHDSDGDRYLFQEFKREGEQMSLGQKRLLAGLKRREFATVWCVRMRGDGRVDWFDVGVSRHVETITEGEYRRRVAAWWGVPLPEDDAMPEGRELGDTRPLTAITAADIRW